MGNHLYLCFNTSSKDNNGTRVFYRKLSWEYTHSRVTFTDCRVSSEFKDIEYTSKITLQVPIDIKFEDKCFIGYCWVHSNRHCNQCCNVEAKKDIKLYLNGENHFLGEFIVSNKGYIVNLDDLTVTVNDDVRDMGSFKFLKPNQENILSLENNRESVIGQIRIRVALRRNDLEKDKIKKQQEANRIKEAEETEQRRLLEVKILKQKSEELIITNFKNGVINNDSDFQFGVKQFQEVTLHNSSTFSRKCHESKWAGCREVLNFKKDHNDKVNILKWTGYYYTVLDKVLYKFNWMSDLDLKVISRNKFIDLMSCASKFWEVIETSIIIKIQDISSAENISKNYVYRDDNENDFFKNNSKIIKYKNDDLEDELD